MKTYYKGLALLAVMCILSLVVYGTSHPNNEKKPNKVVATMDISEALATTVEVDTPETKTEVPEMVLKSYTEDMPLGTLLPERLVLTVGETPTTAVGITFSLETDREEPVIVTVLDEDRQWVGDYTTDAQTLEIQLGESARIAKNYKSTLNQLKPGSTYAYLIHQGDTYSEVFEFKTLSEETNTIIGFFGDTQGYKLSQYEDFAKVYEQALTDRGRLDISIIAGDVVDSGSHFEEWLYLDEAMSGYMSHQLFATAIGNHDVIGSADYYVSTFNYPKNGVAGLEERSYFYDVPQARIAVWDTEAVSTFEEQAQWLEDVMAEATQAFKIVVMHRSVYPMAYDEGHIRPLWEVFDRCGIDLVISGHDHIYSRTTMSKDTKKNLNDGITYVVGGSGSGSKFYEAIFPKSRYWSEFYYDDNQPIYSTIELTSDQIIFKANALNEKGWREIDTFILRRKGAK